MTTITGGTVKYGETKKLADFENRVAHVELSFNLMEDEDTDAAITRVSMLAKAKYQEMTGNARITTPTVAPVGMNLLEPGGLTEIPLKTEKKSKAPAMPPVAAKEETVVVVEAEITIPEPPKTPKKAVEPSETVISDEQLNDATTKTQAAVKNAPAIRKLLNELGVKTPPGRLIDLSQDKRQTYLDGLKLIKPLA